MAEKSSVFTDAMKQIEKDSIGEFGGFVAGQLEDIIPELQSIPDETEVFSPLAIVCWYKGLRYGHRSS